MSADADDWNSFVRNSKSGTFLFDRRYMDYHSDRFEDYSLILVDAAGGICALMPANIAGTELFSHGGLTYGGIITDERMTTCAMIEVFDLVLAFLAEAGIARLIYKTVPSIYHRLPAEEDLYALYHFGAHLCRRDVLSVVDLTARAPVQARRRRGVRRAQDAGIVAEWSDAWEVFWLVLTGNLRDRYGRLPVHSVEEIQLLRERFPDNIQLYVARQSAAIIGGAVLYVSSQVAHVQYIGSSAEGRRLGALDLLFFTLLERFKDLRYFDFGISNEGDGRTLNRGLSEFKDGFGARAIVHDHYQVDFGSRSMALLRSNAK